MTSITGVSKLTCPICDSESDNRFVIPDCIHYEYSDVYDEYLPFVDCAGCGKHKLFNIRTSDAEGGQYFCSIGCLRNAKKGD
jgi:hypothetical protein